MKIYEVVVIGGGASGLMAAGRAAELGASVLLLEKNQQLGVKLLMTGGGRCNFTNQLSPRVLSEFFGVNGRWLIAGLSRFGSDEVIDFFKERGVKVKIEAGGRVFPESNQANEITKALVNYVELGGAEIKLNSAVTKIVVKEKSDFKIILKDQTEINAKKIIIACGGKSYPSSGSSGDAYSWLKSMGHKIITPQPALCQIIVKDEIKKLEGLSIKNSALSLYKEGKKIAEENGDFIFTGGGLSGPSALNLSRAVARQKITGLKIRIDFFMGETKENLDKRIKLAISENKQSNIKNILSRLCHKRLVEFVLEQVNINPDKKGNGLTRIERLALGNFLKEYELSVSGTGGFNEAMITLGGIDLKEVNPKTMASKIISNLYLAGEILDLDGPTGGYNLQASWTTGYLAGENAAK